MGLIVLGVLKVIVHPFPLAVGTGSSQDLKELQDWISN